MPEGSNPLVAQAPQDGDGPGPLTAGNGDYGWAGGIGIAESAMDTFNGISGGNWVEGGLGMLGLAAEGAAAAIDPFGWLMSSVASFLMEHVQPLKDMLDSVCGDPPVIQSYSETWGNVATHLEDTRTTFANAVKNGTTGWTGEAADAYRVSCKEQEESIAGASTVAGAISTVVMIFGEVVAFVRETVRDLIADLVGKLISWVLETVCTLGFGTPVVVAQAVTAISKWATRIAELLKKLVDTIRKVSPLLGKLADIFGSVIKVCARIAGKVTGLDVISTRNITPGGFFQRGGPDGPDLGGKGGNGSGGSGGADGAEGPDGSSGSGGSDSDGSAGSGNPADGADSPSTTGGSSRADSPGSGDNSISSDTTTRGGDGTRSPGTPRGEGGYAGGADAPSPFRGGADGGTPSSPGGDTSQPAGGGDQGLSPSYGAPPSGGGGLSPSHTGPSAPVTHGGQHSDTTAASGLTPSSTAPRTDPGPAHMPPPRGPESGAPSPGPSSPATPQGQQPMGTGPAGAGTPGPGGPGGPGSTSPGARPGATGGWTGMPGGSGASTPNTPDASQARLTGPARHGPNQPGPGTHTPSRPGATQPGPHPQRLDPQGSSPQRPTGHSPNGPAPNGPGPHGPAVGPTPSGPDGHQGGRPGTRPGSYGSSAYIPPAAPRGFTPHGGPETPQPPGPPSPHGMPSHTPPRPYGPGGSGGRPAPAPQGRPHSPGAPARPGAPGGPGEPDRLPGNGPSPRNPAHAPDSGTPPHRTDPVRTDPGAHHRDPAGQSGSDGPHRDDRFTPDEVNQRHAERTPAGVSFHRGDPEMGDLPHRTQPDPDGRYTADVHVTPDGYARIGDRLYTPEEFADILRRNGDYDGRPVRLLGCDAGSNGFAQRLSRALDTEVLAPNKPAWTDSNGRVFSSDYELGPDGKVRPKIPPNGEWSVHRPDGSTSRAGDDGFTPDTADADKQDVDADDARARGQEDPGDGAAADEAHRQRVYKEILDTLNTKPRDSDEFKDFYKRYWRWNEDVKDPVIARKDSGAKYKGVTVPRLNYRDGKYSIKEGKEPIIRSEYRDAPPVRGTRMTCPPGRLAEADYLAAGRPALQDNFSAAKAAKDANTESSGSENSEVGVEKPGHKPGPYSSNFSRGGREPFADEGLREGDEYPDLSGFSLVRRDFGQSLGDLAADHAFADLRKEYLNNGLTLERVDLPDNGANHFDSIHRTSESPPEYVLIEAKGPSANLGDNGGYEQGHPEYVRQIANAMIKRDPHGPEGKHGQEILDALQEGRLRYFCVKAEVGEPEKPVDLEESQRAIRAMSDGYTPEEAEGKGVVGNLPSRYTGYSRREFDLGIGTTRKSVTGGPVT